MQQLQPNLPPPSTRAGTGKSVLRDAQPLRAIERTQVVRAMADGARQMPFLSSHSTRHATPFIRANTITAACRPIRAKAANTSTGLLLKPRRGPLEATKALKGMVLKR